MSTPNVPPAAQPAAPAGTPAPKKSNTMLYVLLGCGGCLAVAGVVGLVLVVLGGLAAKRSGGAMQNAGIAIKLGVQQAQLQTLLEDDKDRSERVEKIYTELEKSAGAGELRKDDVDALQKEIDAATKDGKLDGDEADRILDDAEKLEK